MSRPLRINFASNSYRSDALSVSAQRLVNGYVEYQPRDAKSQAPIFGCPGIDTFATVGIGPIRGGFEMGGVAYVVSRDELYSVDRDGVPILLGNGITGLDPVSITGGSTAGNEQIVIVNGVAGFVYDLSGPSFDQITDGDFHAADTVTWLDGYFLLDWKGRNRFQRSELGDGSSYSSQGYAGAESHPDNVLAVATQEGVLLVLGEKTIEPWDNTGAANNPFARYNNSTTERGIAGSRAFTQEDQATFILGNDRIFYRLDGRQPHRLSTHALEKEWETYSTVADAWCFSASFGGHKWVYVQFPTANKTFAWDIATSRWHERSTSDLTQVENRWRVNTAFNAFGKTILGDGRTGQLGVFNNNTFTEFGQATRMVAIAPHVHADGLNVFMPCLELDIEAGVGLTTGQGEDPQLMLDWSDDGGHTFKPFQLWSSMGRTGEYSRRLRWNDLGSSRSRAYRVTITDPVRRVITAARLPNAYVGEN